MMSRATEGRTLWWAGLTFFCVVSTALYLCFSHLARFELRSSGYIDQLLADSSGGREPLYLLLFVPSVLLTGALMSRKLRPWLEPGPAFCLFTLAAVVVPPQMVALARWPDGGGAARSSTLLVISLAINTALLIWTVLGPSLRQYDIEPDRSAWGWGAVYLGLAATVFALVFLSARGTVTGSDALSYHLPLVASWFRTGSITTGPDIQFQYPENMGFALRWVMAGGSDGFLFLIPFMSALLCVYMLYVIGRTVGHPREVAAVCAGSAALCPPLVYLATSAFNETFGCLCLLLGVYVVMRWSRTPETPWPFLVCSGLAVGMAAGTKYTMLPAGLLVLAFAGALTLQQLERTTDGLKAAAVFLVPALAGGGFWYLRNAVHFGNPFYPMAFLGLPGRNMESLLGLNLMTPSVRMLGYPWTESGYDNPFDQGVGAVFAALSIPATLLCPIIFRRWRDRRQPPSQPARMFLILVWGGFVLHLLLGNVTPRYILPPILLSFVLIGFLWRETASRYFRLAAFLPFLTMTFLLGQTFFNSCLYRRNLTPQEGAERFGLPKVIDQIKPAKILNASWQFFNYPLMGRDYRHEVITLFRDATPEDAVQFDVDYVFVRESQLSAFQARLNIALLAEASQGNGERLSLWRIMSKTR